MGRFLDEDPARFGGGVNFYPYVSNNPVVEIDPLGLADCTYWVGAHVLTCISSGGSGLGAVVVGPEGVESRTEGCKNKANCTDVRNKGPVTPGKYKMNLDERPEHVGWGLYRLEPWPHHFYDGLLYTLHVTRGGFELHLGSITFGCINVDKNNPKAAEQYHRLLNLLQAEDGSNYLTVAR